MGRIRHWLTNLLWWWPAVAIIVGPTMAEAVEFSAHMVLKYQDKMMPGRIFVKDDKMRQEFLDEEGQTITVVRQDKKVYWIILPQQRVYVEFPLRGRLPGQFLQMPAAVLSKRPLGQENVNGLPTDKYEITVAGGPKGVTRETYWVSPKLGTPIKMVSAEKKISLEYRQVKEEKVAEALFEVPPGYTKLAGPSGRLLEKWE